MYVYMHSDGAVTCVRVCMYVYIHMHMCVCVCVCVFPSFLCAVQCCSSLQKKSGRNCSAGTDLFSVEKVLAGWFLMKIKIELLR